MAETRTAENTFTWSHAGETLPPSPKAELHLEAGNAIAYSWGKTFSVNPSFAYSGIGKYKIKLTETMQKDLDAAENILVEYHQPDNPTNGTVLIYSFAKNRRNYAGICFYDLSLPSRIKLFALDEIYKGTVSSGRALISFYPSLAVTQIASGLQVGLTFKNTGEEPIVLGGPSTWSDNPNMLPASHVKVEGWAKQSGFSFLLTNKTLVKGKDFLDEIFVPTGQSATLLFNIPYSDIVFDADSSRKRISQGEYTFAGDMKIDILAPGEMKGQAATPVDFVKNVHLHDQN